MERIGVEAGLSAGDQTRLEADQMFGGQVKLKAYDIKLEARNRDAEQVKVDTNRSFWDKIKNDYETLEAEKRNVDQIKVEVERSIRDKLETESTKKVK